MIKFCLVLFFISTTQLAYSKAEQTLFYMEKSQDEKECHWFFMSPIDLVSKKVHQSSTCHKHVYFHGYKKNIVYLNNTDILLWDMGPGTTPKKIGFIPKISDNLFGSFIMTKKGHYRISRYIKIQSKDILLKGGKNYIIHEGKEYPEYDLPWGTSALVEVLEFKDGKWNSLYKTATRYEAGDTPGFSLVAHLMKESKDFKKLEKLVRGSTCLGSRPINAFDALPTNTKAKIVKATKLQTLAFIKSNKKINVLTNIIQGDYFHYAPPLFFCTEDCSSPIKIHAPNFSQLAIQFSKGGYLLVGREYKNAGVSIYKLGKVKPVKTLKNSLFATWITIPKS